MNGQSEAKERRYADFEIWVDPATAPPYPVRVISSPDGPAVDDKGFQIQLIQVCSNRPDEQSRKEFGRQLFETLFNGDVRHVGMAA